MKPVLLAAVLFLLAGCSANLAPLQNAPGSVALTTTGPWTSMVYLARLSDGGVMVVDLGWIGADQKIRERLREMGATPDQVRAVFLTHSHRDHVWGWKTVRDAPFYLAAAEVDRFVGAAEHRGWLARLADRVNPPDLPAPGELDLRPFSRDTTLVLGADTVQAFLVPGHTTGSAAYLFRGVLFVGDAVYGAPLLVHRGARWEFSDDMAESRRSVAALWDKVRGREVRWVCTAHAKCVPYRAR